MVSWYFMQSVDEFFRQRYKLCVKLLSNKTFLMIEKLYFVQLMILPNCWELAVNLVNFCYVLCPNFWRVHAFSAGFNVVNLTVGLNKCLNFQVFSPLLSNFRQNFSSVRMKFMSTGVAQSNQWRCLRWLLCLRWKAIDFPQWRL